MFNVYRKSAEEKVVAENSKIKYKTVTQNLQRLKIEIVLKNKEKYNKTVEGSANGSTLDWGTPRGFITATRQFDDLLEHYQKTGYFKVDIDNSNAKLIPNVEIAEINICQEKLIHTIKLFETESELKTYKVCNQLSELVDKISC